MKDLISNLYLMLNRLIIYLLQVSFLNFSSLKVRDLVGILVAACPPGDCDLGGFRFLCFVCCGCPESEISDISVKVLRGMQVPRDDTPHAPNHAISFWLVLLATVYCNAIT